jgi:hypothetical protein
MSEERIQTLNPRKGKSGTRISKEKYERLRTAIIDSLEECGQLTFSELRDEVEQKLAGNFDGSISWYYTTVKLDLEARGILERIGKGSPQKLQLVTPTE